MRVKLPKWNVTLLRPEWISAVPPFCPCFRPGCSRRHRRRYRGAVPDGRPDAAVALLSGGLPRRVAYFPSGPSTGAKDEADRLIVQGRLDEARKMKGPERSALLAQARSVLLEHWRGASSATFPCKTLDEWRVVDLVRESTDRFWVPRRDGVNGEDLSLDF